MVKRRYKRVLTGALGILVLAGVSLWGYNQMMARRAAETALSNKYHLAFYNMVNSIQNMEVLLSKALVGEETWQDSQIFMRLWQDSVAAQSSLSQIPVPEATMARTIKYLNQVGAYSQSLAVQTAGGKPKSSEQWQTLQRLYKQAGELNAEMQQLENRVANGTLTMSELRRESGTWLRRQGPQLADNDFQAIDRNMQRFPSLIYDGPFSDHIDRKTPLGLSGSRISPDQARNKALSFIDQRPDVTYIANAVRSDDGRIPVYRVEVTPRPATNGEGIAMGVAQQGGPVVWMLNSRNIGNKAALSARQAGDRAAGFLRDRGFSDIEPTYYEVRDNVAVYNFAATQGGAILYPDLIKVSVALDNGQVVGFDASGYYMSHHRRKLPAPKLTVEQARKKLSPKLTEVTPGRLALIPRTVDQEVLTYEFQGRLDNDVFLVYIDAVTGEEENVLRVIRTNNGILTM